MVIIHGWPFQMFEQKISCYEMCEQLRIIHLWHIIHFLKKPFSTMVPTNPKY
jgi:hypothetical protein